MADIKLIALDLDGTLLTTDKRLTDRTKATLKAARDRGIKVRTCMKRPCLVTFIWRLLKS